MASAASSASGSATLRAVIFDIDGTLLDWNGSSSTIGGKQHRLSYLSNVYWHVVRHVHPIDASEDQFHETALAILDQSWLAAKEGHSAPHIGRTLSKTLEALNVPKEKIDPVQLMKVYDWSPVPGVVAFPDIFEVLPILLKAGIRTALITNSGHPMWMRDVELRAYDLLDFFPECRISAADVGHLKPYPEIFRAALDCLGVQPAEAIYVGDEPWSDVVGAHNVGMRAALRIGENVILDQDPEARGDGFLIEPDGEINTLHDLLTLLDQWYPGWR